GAVAPIERLQAVDFLPERGLVDAVVAKQRLLHVAGDQGLVEVPDHGDDVLGEQLAGHVAKTNATWSFPQDATASTARAGSVEREADRHHGCGDDRAGQIDRPDPPAP